MLETDVAWIDEYDAYVHQVSFARSDEIIAFDQALAALKRLVGIVTT